MFEDVLARWGFLGVPSSAAAHWPGIEQAPDVLRSRGIVERLNARGVNVTDFGNMNRVRFTARLEEGGVNNLSAVQAVLERARLRVAAMLQRGYRPLVIGGECTLTIALVCAFADQERDVGVVYVDGGLDVVVPTEHPEEPILDAMGVAHMLDLPGAVESLASIGPRRPLLDPSQLVYFGDTQADRTDESVPCARFPAAVVNADPEGAARRALAALDASEIIVHVDADVLDFLEVPAGDIAIYGGGLQLDSLKRSLRVLAQDPRCRGVVLVEYNPDHDPARQASTALVDLLVDALADAPSATTATGAEGRRRRDDG